MKKIVLVLAVIIGILCINKTEKVIIPKESIRLRVIANSDYSKDQNLKKKIVKNLSTKFVETNNLKNIQETRNYIHKKLPEFTEIVDKTIKENNSDNSLNDVIRKLLNLLNVKCTVNVEKDKIEIMQQYKRYLKNESLELLYPNLVLDWDCEKNRGLKLSNFTKGSHTKVHWKCAKCGNTWIAEIKSRVSGSGCELCSRQNAIKARSCKVLNIDTNTIYASLTEAQRLTGVERHSIANCCKGKTKMAGGFQWRHV